VALLLAWGFWLFLPGTGVAQETEGTGNLTPLDHPVFVLLPNVPPIKPGFRVTLWFLLVDTDGLPVATDVAASVKVDQGQIERFEQRRPGLYEVLYSAPREAGPRQAAIEIQAVLDGVPISQTFTVPIQVSGEGSIDLTLRRSHLTLGRDMELPFVIQGVRPDGVPLEAKDLTVRTSVGDVQRLRTVKPGRVEGVFVPTDIKTPLVAILAAFVGEGEEKAMAWRSIRVIATPRIPVATEPGSTAWVEVGRRRFGPVKVGPSGKVWIPIEVPPAISSVVVNARDAAGNTTRYSVNLSIPPFRRALLHLDREEYRVDEARPLGVTLILVQEDGEPASLMEATLSATAGRLGGMVEVAPGTFTTAYFPPAEPGLQEIRARVPLAEGAEQVYTASVEVRVGTPARVELAVNPTNMRADDPPAEVSLKVFDKAGNPATGVIPKAEVDFGTIGRFRAIGPGEYVAAYRPRLNIDAATRDSSGLVHVPIRAWVERVAGDGPAVELSVVPDRMIVDGGGASVTLNVTALDRWGVPVRGIPLTAVVEQGDGRISQPQVTDARGRADFLYHSGVQLGPVIVLVRSDRGDLAARTLLLQAGPGTVDPSFVEWLSSLQRETRTVLSAETTVVVRAGLVKRLQISALPNLVYTGRGQSSQLRIRLEDHLGNTVVDPSIQVKATLGTVSDLKFTSDGIYTARYTPPEIARAAALDVVHVTNPEGEYSGSTEIQVFRREGRRLGALRLGYVTNLAAIGSPVVDLQGMLRPPRTPPGLYVGVSAAYYTFTAEGATSIRYDIFPIHLFACMRSQTGRYTPYGGVGPIAALALVGAPIPTSYLGDSGVPPSEPGDDQSITAQWHLVRALGLFPGFGALLGIEVGIGPGGISVESAISWVKGRNILDDVVEGGTNLGGLVIRTGYVAHF